MIVRESAHIGSLKRLDFFSFPHDDLGPLPFPYDQPDVEKFEDPFLGRETMKKLKEKFAKKIAAPVKKITKKIVGKRVAAAVTRQAKKVREVVKKAGRPLMKGFKKYFVKVAPFLSIAVQIFNIIPGLGVALGIAISVGSAAMQMAQNLKAMKAAKRLSEQQDAEMTAESVEADQQAHESLDTAYDKGESLFTTDYGMNREVWKGLSVEGKTRFLKEAVAIANQKKLAEVGVTPKQFSAMTNEEQDATLEKAFGTSPWTWVALAGGGIVIAVTIALILKKKSQRPG